MHKYNWSCFDLFCSFFLTSSSIGKVSTELCVTTAVSEPEVTNMLNDVVLILQNRAQAATELLQELNSDVSGNFVEEVSVNVIRTYCCFIFSIHMAVQNQSRFWTRLLKTMKLMNRNYAVTV